MNFEFATATRILFGAGRLAEIGPLVRAFGPRALVVNGASPTRSTRLRALLAEAGVTVVPWTVGHEPTLADAEAGTQLARAEGVLSVISVGGGSVLDAGKAIAVFATNPGGALDYVEVIGRGQTLGTDSLPFVAIPTTAGTGAEVTRNAVLSSPEHRLKVSLRSPRMLPRVALVDPELALNLPPTLTASCGLDALTQLIEAFVSVRANPLTDALCRDGLPRIATALPRAHTHGGDLAARAELALAALYSGLALSNAGLGAVHGFSGPVGGRFGVPHGAVCAALLAPVTAVNIQALQTRQPDSPALIRYAEAARCLNGRSDATPGDLVTTLRTLIARLHIPGLATYHVTPDDFPELIRQSRQSSSMKGNPIELTDAELQTALIRAL
ncbi:MAG TPA: iron-containing alcohol dehydrogenase [Verrucomicrobiota bacterium]|nr:alcohol dehydrogenase [Verrucomicrobiales bacterium]HRI11604.1 iron-containing alcohol dehydrogenase [Verrucomicrobiota bacterium]